MKKLLLHVCCGPCGVYTAKKLREDYQVSLFFYNPNIYPREEYDIRLAEVKKWVKQDNFELIEGEFNQADWFEVVKGLEEEPEGGARCPVCFKFRLIEAAKYAKKSGFGYLASTLTSGRNKRASIINPIGIQVAKEQGLEFIEGDWKKQGGQTESCRLSKEHDFYRQNYCGCKFSLR